MTSRTASTASTVSTGVDQAPKGVSAARAATPKAAVPTDRPAVVRSRSTEADSLGLFLRDLDHHPLPDHEAQTELAKRVAAGDEAARREMAAANLRLVVHWARRYQDLSLIHI